MRAGADPLVENGTSVMYRLKLSLETSWPVIWTRRRWPLAWASIERPAPVSEKKMIPPPSAGICSEPVLAITVRPDVIVTAMWQVLELKQTAGSPPTPLEETNALRPAIPM